MQMTQDSLATLIGKYSLQNSLGISPEQSMHFAGVIAQAVLAAMGTGRTDTTQNLFDSAATYIEERGGKAIVLGGVGVMAKDEFKYSLVIDVVGNPPKKQVSNE